MNYSQRVGGIILVSTLTVQGASIQEPTETCKLSILSRAAIIKSPLVNTVRTPIPTPMGIFSGYPSKGLKFAWFINGSSTKVVPWNLWRANLLEAIPWPTECMP